MTINLPDLEPRIQHAVSHYWNTLDTQSGETDDRRQAVVGGRQMDAFCELVNWVLISNGLSTASVFVQERRVLPGYFRATKDWDLVVVHQRHLVAAIEFKSQVGSFGNNFNNRTEEAIGNAVDLWTAFREGAFGVDRPRPFLGWVMLLEDSEKSRNTVWLDEPHFPVFPEFVAAEQPTPTKGKKKPARRKGVSYQKRYEILLRRLMMERWYDSAALLVSTSDQGTDGRFSEPAADLTMRRLLAGLAGHVAAYLAGLPPEPPTPPTGTS